MDFKSLPELVENPTKEEGSKAEALRLKKREELTTLVCSLNGKMASGRTWKSRVCLVSSVSDTTRPLDSLQWFESEHGHP